ncbi:hypothetical protein Q1695_015920 [Nippostrongylus brasiliensis]|nr:hypothetical protein Q1695_015920 [Nippostrongylus brasiliensis]
MCSAKCLLLLLLASRIDVVNSGRCTDLTTWQQSTVQEFQDRLVSGTKFECDCAERAEGIAWAATINANRDNYEKVYHVFTTTLKGRPLANQYDQLRCMLDKLKNEHSDQIRQNVKKGMTYGCAYTRTPKAPAIMDNVSQALTCVYVLSDSTSRYYGEGVRTLFHNFDESIEHLKQVNTTRLFGCATDCMKISENPAESLPYRCALVCVIELKEGEVCQQ